MVGLIISLRDASIRTHVVTMGLGETDEQSRTR